MPISGVLLHCDPEQIRQVQEDIALRPHSEVRAVRDDTLVVVTDTSDLDQDRQEVAALDQLPGVFGTQVVFCNVEDIAGGEAVEPAGPAEH